MASPGFSINVTAVKALEQDAGKLTNQLLDQSTTGSYPYVQTAVGLGDVISSMADQPGMGTWLKSYAAALQGVATEYQNFGQMLADLTDALAKTANIHEAADQKHSKDFKAAVIQVTGSDGHVPGGGYSTDAPGPGSNTSVVAPGPPPSPSTQNSSNNTTVV